MTLVAAGHEGADFGLGHALQVVHHLGDAAKARKAGVAGAGAIGQGPPLEHHHPQIGAGAAERPGGIEPHDAPANDRDIEIAEIGVVLPVAQRHGVRLAGGPAGGLRRSAVR